MFNTKHFFIALLATFAPATLFAATIVEGIDYADAPSADLGSIGGGSHFISGQLNGSCLEVTGPIGASEPFSCLFGADPQDIFTIEIEAGHQVLGFNVIFASVQQGASSFGSGIAYASSQESFSFNSLADGIYTLNGLAPTSGVLTFILSGDDSDVGSDWSSDWTVELAVSQVPTPGALGLLAGGLMGLGALGRRRKSV